MLSRDFATLEETVVRILAESPGLPAKEIKTRLEAEGHEYSLQGLYLALQKLERTGVVVKSAKRFSLNLMWVFELMNLADVMYDHYVSHPEALALSPAQGEKYSWKFRSLLRMDDFRLQSRLSLLNELNLKQTFVWMPHLLFVLLRPRRIKEIGELLLKENRRAYSIVGSRTALDRDCISQVEGTAFIFSSGRPDFELPSDKYVEILGPYILESRVEGSLREKIEGLFSKYKKVSQIPAVDMLDLIRNRATSYVTITNAPQRAAKLRRQFVKYFGIREEASLKDEGE